MNITVIHPSRSRPIKSIHTMNRWGKAANFPFELIVSLDDTDDDVGRYLSYYEGFLKSKVIVNRNRSCVDAINNAAKVATGDLFVVVSDDTQCFDLWDNELLKLVEGKEDYLLKTDDGIQDYIVTMTVMDRKYYERDGYIYHPDFFHQFSDTHMTCVADIRGRLIHSKLKFPHLHPSYSGGREMTDALNTRNDLSWKDGQDTFVRLMKQFTPEERDRIKNPGMRNFLRKFGL